MPKKTTTTAAVDEALAYVTVLEHDQTRVREMLEGAEREAKNARSKDEEELRRASRELAGLREVDADIARELKEAREILGRLQQEGEVARTEAERDLIAERLQGVQKKTRAAYLKTLDTTLERLQEVNELLGERRKLERRLSELHRALGRDRVSTGGRVRIEPIFMGREDALPDDKKAAQAFELLIEHRVAHGASRDELLRETKARHEANRIRTAQGFWKSKKEVLERFKDRGVAPQARAEYEELVALFERFPSEPTTLEEAAGLGK
jgi:hypothetical protein